MPGVVHDIITILDSIETAVYTALSKELEDVPTPCSSDGDIFNSDITCTSVQTFLNTVESTCNGDKICISEQFDPYFGTYKVNNLPYLAFCTSDMLTLPNGCSITNQVMSCSPYEMLKEAILLPINRTISGNLVNMTITNNITDCFSIETSRVHLFERYILEGLISTTEYANDTLIGTNPATLTTSFYNIYPYEDGYKCTYGDFLNQDGFSCTDAIV